MWWWTASYIQNLMCELELVSSPQLYFYDNDDDNNEGKGDVVDVVDDDDDRN